MPTIFSLTQQDALARSGRLSLPHGDIATPVFMPVGTQASVKTLTSEDLESLSCGMILANTYHLWLRPGIGEIVGAGGLHSFMSWNGNLLTDSGGFQVFSLARRRDISEEGATFRSHIDGALQRLTPESVAQAQIDMGVDVAMCLDECPPYPCSREEARDMMERTLRWTARAREVWQVKPSPTQLFAIVQGSTFPDLRRESAQRTVEMDFPGYAVGGLSVGEPREDLPGLLAASLEALPSDRPRYLMGVGSPPDILAAVECGIDMFDSVFPTRNARNGQALTWQGPRNLRTEAARQDPNPLEAACPCLACRRYSVRYLAHLFRAGELSVWRLMTLHNLTFMLSFLGKLRESVQAGTFQQFKKTFLSRYHLPQNRSAAPVGGP